MAYDPEIHHRRSIRLRGFDYASPGAYFITICAQDRAALFGHVIGQDVALSPAGEMLIAEWQSLASAHIRVQIDEFIVMPNHVHGVIWIDAAEPRNEDPRQAEPITLSQIVQRYKSVTTNRYIAGVRGSNWPAFNGKLWQRNYFEHVIRDEDALAQVRYYIRTNPSRWRMDMENPLGEASDDHEKWIRALANHGGELKASRLAGMPPKGDL